MTTLRIRVELSGGAELLFSEQKHLELEISVASTIVDLLHVLREQHLQQRPELFLGDDGDSVRPGILVLVNDADADLVGGVDYVLQNNDTITFISTLHGG